MECSEQGCIRGVFAKGLCRRHYDEARIAVAPQCSVEGCETQARAKSLCERHYREKLAQTAKRCGVTGCGRAAIAGGLCDAHRQRKAKHRHVSPTRPKDWGGREAHPLYEIYQWRRRNASRDGLAPAWANDFWRFVEDVGERPTPRHRLKRLDTSRAWAPDNVEWREVKLSVTDAADNAEYMRRWQREYRAREPERYAKYEFGRRYGIQLEDYEALFRRQGGVCAICREPETARNPTTQQPRRLAVDHCHNSTKVRGLLCSRCNTGIGAFKESPDRIRSALRYLKRHTTPPDGG